MWTKDEAISKGYMRPSNGGEGTAMAEAYRRGELSMIIVDEGHRSQPWYRKMKPAE